MPNHRQIETPKTPSSERKVDMSPELSAELKRVLVEKKKAVFAAGKPFDMEQWAFPHDKGTPIFHLDFLRRIWYKLQDQAKLRRRTPHDLRRTCSTKLGEIPVPGHLIDRITNHKPSGITDRVYNKYDYLKEKREALSAFGARLVRIVSDLEIVKAETAKS
jgi:integrase